MRVLKNFSDDEKLRAAIVIPSYSEGGDILKTIRSWVLQWISSGVRSALFVVVNNSKDSPVEAKKSNSLTFGLVESLLKGEKNPSLALDLEQWDEYSQVHDLIQQVRFRIGLIDLWSKNHAPGQCNVGMARDVGANVAGDHLSDDGFFIMTDADTVPVRNYLLNAGRYLKKNAEVAALRGIVTCREGKPRNRERIVLGFCVDKLEDLMKSVALIYGLRIPDRTPFPHLSGGNGVVRKSAYVSAGGIPHINGAEDTELSRNILRQGLSIHDLRWALEVNTSSRVSLRTDAGHGFGQVLKIVYEYLDNPWDIPVLPFEACLFMEFLLGTISYANKRDLNEVNWLAYIEGQLLKNGFRWFRPHHLKRLSAYKEKDHTLPHAHFNRLLVVEIERIAEQIYGKIPFWKAADQWAIELIRLEQTQKNPSDILRSSFRPNGRTPYWYLEQTLFQLEILGEVLEKRKRELINELETVEVITIDGW